MRILKAKQSHPKKQIFQISDLTYVKHDIPHRDILEGRDMMFPIEIEKRKMSSTPRMGALGTPYIEKELVVYRGSQRVTAAIKLGYTHIEGIIINE